MPRMRSEGSKGCVPGDPEDHRQNAAGYSEENWGLAEVSGEKS